MARTIYSKWWPLPDVLVWPITDTLEAELARRTWDHYISLSPNAQAHKDSGNCTVLFVELNVSNPGLIVTLGYPGGKR